MLDLRGGEAEIIKNNKKEEAQRNTSATRQTMERMPWAFLTKGEKTQGETGMALEQRGAQKKRLASAWSNYTPSTERGAEFSLHGSANLGKKKDGWRSGLLEQRRKREGKATGPTLIQL